MESVLIFTDTHQIENEQDFLGDVIPVFQSVYDAFKVLNITTTVTEINNLINWSVNGNGAPNFIQEFAINKLLDAAAPYVLNGVPLTRESVKSMIVIPDVTPVINAIKAGSSIFNNSIVKGVRVNLLTLVEDVIAKSAGADDAIVSEFTYYTKTDASAALATSLQSVCNALNTHDAANKEAILKSLVDGKYPLRQMQTPIPGIAIIEATFVPYLNYIQKFEQTGSLFTM